MKPLNVLVRGSAVAVGLTMAAAANAFPHSECGFLSESLPECFGGDRGMAHVRIGSTIGRQFSAISGAADARLSAAGSAPGATASAGLRGAAAGAASGKWNVWGNMGTTNTKQNYSVGFATVDSETDVLTTVFGTDYTLSPNMVVGISAAIDDGEMDMRGGGGTTTTKGYTIAPYLALQLNKEWSADFSAGWGQGDATIASTSDVDFDRWFAGANLSYGRWSGNWQYSGKAGLLHAEEDFDNVNFLGASVAGTAARNKIQQAYFGAQVGYWMNGTMPYAGLKYTADLHRSTSQAAAGPDPIGKGAWVWTAGVNFFSVANGVTGGVVYTQEEGRSSQKNHNLTANVSIRF